MAFICIFQLNNGAIKESVKFTFLEYIEDPLGNITLLLLKLLKLYSINKPAFIYSNSPSFPSSKGAIQSGDKLDSQTKIAYFLCRRRKTSLTVGHMQLSALNKIY